MESGGVDPYLFLVSFQSRTRSVPRTFKRGHLLVVLSALARFFVLRFSLVFSFLFRFYFHIFPYLVVFCIPASLYPFCFFSVVLQPFSDPYLASRVVSPFAHILFFRCYFSLSPSPFPTAMHVCIKSQSMSMSVFCMLVKVGISSPFFLASPFSCSLYS